MSEVEETVRAAMKKAYLLGQSYLRLADSDWTSKHRKADQVARDFSTLVDETVAELEAQIAAHERVCAGTWVSGVEWLPEDGWHVTAVMKMQHNGPPKMDHDREYYSSEWKVWRTYDAEPPDFVLRVKLPTSSGEEE